MNDKRQQQEIISDVMVGKQISEADWSLLVAQARVSTTQNVQSVVQGTQTPIGYSFNFATLSRFGRMVHCDDQQKSEHALFVKYGHGSEEELPRLVRNEAALSQFITSQDATVDALCMMLDQDADTRFILEIYSTDGTQWTTEYQRNLENLREQDINRRTKKITVPQMQGVLAGKHGKMAYRTLGAAERFAAYALEKKQAHRILPGRPTQSTVTYPHTCFTDLAQKSGATDAEVQSAIDIWTAIRLKDDAVRHRFVASQAVRSSSVTKRLVVLYGSTHSDKGVSPFHSVPPLEAYLSQTHQTSVLEPYGSDAGVTPGVLSLKNMTVPLARIAFNIPATTQK